MTSLRSLVILLFLFVVVPVNAQPWMADLNTKCGGEKPSFKEIQASFNQYMEDKEPEHRTDFQQFKQWEWYMQRHLCSDGTFNPYASWNAWLDKKNWIESHRHNGLDELNEADWQEAGPFLTRDSNTGGMGRLNCVTFHPTNPDIFYVGAASGGVWKTENHGQAWTALTDDLPILGVSDIAIDPTNPNIIYIATGDRDALDTPSVGVLKSTDGGTTWNSTGLTSTLDDAFYVNKIVIHPSNPSILVAATNDKIYRTADAGVTWTHCSMDQFQIPVPVKDLVVDPGNGDYWYAGAADMGICEVWVSTDGGITWSTQDCFQNGGPGELVERVAVAISPVNSSRIYAAGVSLIGTFQGLWTSTDRGQTWTLMSNSPNIMGSETDGSDIRIGQGRYSLTIVADPENERTIYVGGINLWKSTDAGATWSIVTNWQDSGTIPYVHGGHHALKFNGNNLYSCNEGGLSYTTDDGASWTDISSGLVISQVLRLGSFQGSADVTFVLNGTLENGTNLYNQGTWTSEIVGSGMECGVDFENPDIMYGEMYAGWMMKTVDGGQSWYPCNDGSSADGSFISPIYISESHPGTLFKATSSVFKSINYGETWTAISEAMWSVAPIALMAVAPSDENIIYTYGANTGTECISVTQDGGANWNYYSGPTPNFINYMTVDPRDPRAVYVAVGGYTSGSKVFRSTDACASWTNLSGDLPNVPVNSLEIHPHNSDHLYIGTETGVFFSSDRGQTWQDYSENLPNVAVQELEIHRNSNTLLAATFGRGMWMSSAESPVTEDVPVLPFAQVDNDGLVTYSWHSPEWGGTGLEQYIVYRNDTEIARTTQLSITDQLIVAGEYTYTVRASYSTGNSGLSVPFTIRWSVTSTSESPLEQPVGYDLLSAYPNPFNPATTVTLALPEKSNVDIKVYNVLGSEVSRLYHGRLNAGNHSFIFDGSKLVSGVYFIRATVPGKLDAKRKVILMK